VSCVAEKAMVQVWSLVVASIVAAVCATVTANSISGGVHKTETGWVRQETGCSMKQLCCQGKNNTCRVDGPRETNSDSFTCFCDSSCSELGDCCVDYKRTCQRQYLYDFVRSGTDIISLLILPSIHPSLFAQKFSHNTQQSY